MRLAGKTGRAALLAAVAMALSAPLAGCGASQPKTQQPSGIELLRQQAKEHPKDPDIQRRLALAELLAADGDPERAAPQIERALELAGDDERLLLAAGLEREARGAPAEALDRLLAALEAAKGSSRPQAPRVAEVAAAALEDLIGLAPGYAEAFEERAVPLLDDPGHVGAAARHTLAEIGIELAYREGEPDRAREIAGSVGCVTDWRVAGPFGPRALLGFDRRHADATEPGPLAESYDLGPRRGEQPTRRLEARGCTVHVGGSSVAGPGTTYVEGFVEIEDGGERVVRLESPNAVELYVDGERALRLDARREPTPGVSFHPLELEPGRHELTVKITTRHPNPVLMLSVMEGEAGEPVTGDGPLAVYLRGATAVARGDHVAAREALRRTEQEGGGSPIVLALRSGVALSDPLRPSDMRRDEARRLLRAAAKRDPRAWQPALRLAQLQAAEGRLVAAIESLREARDKWPEVVAIPLTLGDLLLERGWDAEARRVIVAAGEVAPGTCAPIRARLALARQRDRAATIRDLTEELVACDARSEARLSELVRQRRWDDAVAEVERLAALEPKQHHDRVLGRKLQLARARGDRDRVRELLKELAKLEPRSSSIPRQRADLQLAAGEPEQAKKTLAQAIETDPSAMASLRWIHRTIGGEAEIDRWRIDGAEALREFEQSERSYDAPQVLVLDYTGIRVFEDGSQLQLTHQIYKVQSEEAVDRLGEYSRPSGARLLTLHTIKEDGRRLEPDPIQGKDSISLPDLEVGDYVEYEYVQMQDAPGAFPDGVTGVRFYFQSFEIPFDVSIYKVAVPKSMQLMVSPRGPAPEPEETTEGELSVTTWKVTESPALEKEPSSIPAREWIPSIDWGVKAGWEPLVGGLRDLLSDKNVRDPAAARLAERVAGEGDDRERARRLYHWVLENVEDNDEVFGLAPAMLAGRTGDRSRVLAYLLSLTGVRSKLVLARDAGTDQTRSKLADDQTYKHLLVMLPGGDSPTYLSTMQRGAPFGYLPAALRGQDALVLEEGASRVTLPALEPGQDRHAFEADVQLRRDGSAHVAVVETLHGAGAVSWRNNLEGVPEAVLEERFGTQYVARLVPGAQLTSLAIEGREQPEKPFVMRYEFDVGSLGRKRGSQWMVPGLLTNDLSPIYARAAERSTTQLVAPPVDTRVTVRLRAPEGASIAAAPSDVSLQAQGGARFEMTSSRTEGALVTKRSLWVPIMRVQPERYPRFAAFCRAVDEAEAREIPVRL